MSSNSLAFSLPLRRQRGLAFSRAAWSMSQIAATRASGSLRIGVQMIGAAAAESDDADVDLFVRAPDARRRGSRGRAEEKPAGSRMRHCDSPCFRQTSGSAYLSGSRA